MPGRRERATVRTNRVDLFAREWLGDDSDASRRKIIEWNWHSWFRHQRNATFWLQPGRLYFVEPPGFPARPALTLNGRILTVQGPVGEEVLLLGPVAEE